MQTACSYPTDPDVIFGVASNRSSEDVLSDPHRGRSRTCDVSHFLRSHVCHPHPLQNALTHYGRMSITLDAVDQHDTQPCSRKKEGPLPVSLWLSKRYPKTLLLRFKDPPFSRMSIADRLQRDHPTLFFPIHERRRKENKEKRGVRRI